MIPDGLQRLDESVFLAMNRFLHDAGGSAVDYLLKFHNQLGNAVVAVLILGAALVLDPDGRRWLRRVATVVVALGAVGLVNLGLKTVVARPRPLDAIPDAFARGAATTAFGEYASISSFPSGHTATAFALATVLAIWAGEIPSPLRRRLARVFLFTAATLTGVARIYAGVHFPSDVVAGAIVGSAAGWGAAALFRIPKPEVSP